MTDNIKSKIGLGPMSPEIIEAIIKSSEILGKPLMLISTQNQIDWNGGYVNKWNTKNYVDFIKQLKKKYKNSSIYLCRDHCGPFFKTESIDEVYKTIRDDIQNGFDLIHVDFSKFSKDKKEVLEETKKVVKWILKENPLTSVEIGTEENVGMFKENIKEIEKEFNYLSEIVIPEFYVVQTGSLVREINQYGGFNKEFVKLVHEFLSKHGVKLKEHNSDYLNLEQISARKHFIDAMNIAPQLGVLQTMTVLNEALVYGVDIRPYLQRSFASNKWAKWMQDNTGDNKMLCSIIAGHYNFTSDEYKRLVDQLENYTDINNTIINKIIGLVKYYSDAFSF